VKYAFEFLVARRYLKAKRKETVISLITAISVLGVAAGVMALIISLSINSGFRNTLQRNLLGATAHVTILEKSRDTGIEDWRQMTAALSRIPQVTSVEPTLYGQVFLSGPLQSDGAVIKGVRTDSAAQRADVVMHLKEGSFEDLDVDQGGMPGIILGSRLARRTGMMLHAVVTVTSPQGELTPFGPRPSYHKMRVVGIFESGFFDLDSSWAFASLPSVQRILSLADVVNAVELKIDDIYRAPEIAQAAEKTAGERYAATTWMEQNRQILGALRMERVVTIITIGLIELIAALNILITLTMLVMEKYRDISILMSMGARREQIRRIFMLQGVIIGVIGTIIGLIAGYTLSFLADHYRWLGLDEEVYALAFVPFEPRWIDGLWVAAAAIGISFIATLYPARNATRIAPAEALRYE
jgi:lipoprotein-releasing system permease protein